MTLSRIYIQSSKSMPREARLTKLIERFLGLLVLLSLFSLPALSQQTTPAQAERVKRIEESLLSPCCYGEPVSRHMSDIAIQMRKEIPQMVISGQSDKEILDYYVGLYGERVLMEPMGNKKIALYSIPIFISTVGISLVLLLLRRWMQQKPVLTLNSAASNPLDEKTKAEIWKAVDEG